MSKKFLVNNLSQTDDLLVTATTITEHIHSNSCGICSHCKIGSVKLLEGISNLENGGHSIGYIEALLKLATYVEKRAQCSLGQQSGEAFISIINIYKMKINS